MSWLVQKFVDDLLFMTLIPLTNRTVLYYLAFMLPAFAIFYLERKKQFVGIYIGALRQGEKGKFIQTMRRQSQGRSV